MNSYKELPCRRCGRVWKWSYDKKSLPYCPEGYGCEAKEPSVKDLIDEIMKRLDNIEMKINSIPPVQPVYPTAPVPPHLNSTVCSKCGMEWKGVMGYVCSHNDCPTQLKASWQSFDVESIDPDERSWYYDGDGTKRKKE